MALEKRKAGWYGDGQDDIRPELLRYSKSNGYAIHHFADAVCKCGHRTFWLIYDEQQGAAVRMCTECETEHPMGDSAAYVEEAEFDEAVCICDGDEFEVTVGVSLYDDSADVRWLYLGCRCVACGLLGCYADWKNEFIGYQALLDNV